MTIRLFRYGVRLRNSIERLGQLDDFYPSLTIVLRWPVVIFKYLSEDGFLF